MVAYHELSPTLTLPNGVGIKGLAHHNLIEFSNCQVQRAYCSIGENTIEKINSSKPATSLDTLPCVHPTVIE